MDPATVLSRLRLRHDQTGFDSNKPDAHFAFHPLERFRSGPPLPPATARPRCSEMKTGCNGSGSVTETDELQTFGVAVFDPAALPSRLRALALKSRSGKLLKRLGFSLDAGHPVEDGC